MVFNHWIPRIRDSIIESLYFILNCTIICIFRFVSLIGGQLTRLSLIGIYIYLYICHYQHWWLIISIRITCANNADQTNGPTDKRHFHLICCRTSSTGSREAAAWAFIRYCLGRKISWSFWSALMTHFYHILLCKNCMQIYDLWGNIESTDANLSPNSS